MDYNRGYWSAALITGTTVFLLVAFFYTLEAWFGTPSIPERPFFGEPLLTVLALAEPVLSYLGIVTVGGFWVHVNAFALGAVGGLVVQMFIVDAVRRREAAAPSSAPAPPRQKPAEGETDA